jgi:hypothetical protein
MQSMQRRGPQNPEAAPEGDNRASEDPQNRGVSEMWQPNRRQWTVIWIAVGLCALFWLPGALTGNEADERVGNAVVPLVLVVAALLVWRFSAKK